MFALFAQFYGITLWYVANPAIHIYGISNVADM